EDRGRAGVHQEEWFRPGPTAGHRLHARHSRGDLRAEKAEALQADATLDLVAQVVEAKPAVAHRWRRGAVVEHSDGDRVEDGADAEGAQRLHQFRQIEIAHLEPARPIYAFG